MSATATELVPGRRGGVSRLWNRQLDSYPDTGPRVLFLAITVLATVTLYYELYVGGSVATLLLANLKMSFTFYVVILAFGNLLGAFGSLFAGRRTYVRRSRALNRGSKRFVPADPLRWQPQW